MPNLPSFHIPFAELSAEARALFFINALAALARYGLQRPNRSELALRLESIWNHNRLLPGDLSDPHRMTAMLKAHLAPHKVDEDAK